jgi:hypothetical protein
VVRGGSGGRARGIVVLTLPPGGLYIVGRGAPLHPPQANLGRRPGRRWRAAAARARAGWPSLGKP